MGDGTGPKSGGEEVDYMAINCAIAFFTDGGFGRGVRSLFSFYGPKAVIWLIGLA